MHEILWILVVAGGSIYFLLLRANTTITKGEAILALIGLGLIVGDVFRRTIVPGESFPIKQDIVGIVGAGIFLSWALVRSVIFARRWALVMRAINDGEVGVLVTDKDGHIMYFNDIAEEVSGYKAGEVLGKRVVDVFYKDKEVAEAVNALLWGEVEFDEIGELVKKCGETVRILDINEESGTLKFRTRVRMKDGEMHNVMVVKSPIRDEKGKTIGHVGYVMDVSSEESMKEAVLEGIGAGLLAMNEEGVVLWVNGLAKRWFANREPLIGKKCCEVLAGGKKCEICSFRQALEHNEIQTHFGDEIEIETAEGRKFVKIFSVPVVEGGHVSRVMMLLMDITERKLLEIHKDAFERRLVSIIDSTPDAVITTNMNGKVTSWNRGAENIFGWREEEALGREIVDLIKGLDWEIVKRRALRGNFETMELELEGKEGVVNGIVSASVIRDAKGNVKELCFIIVDVTQLRRLQEELTQAEKLWALGELVSGIAHELNNPLTGILGFAQLLMMRNDVNEEVAESLEKINREALRCKRIVENLLDFARKRPPEKVALNLKQIVENALELLSYQLKVDGVEVVRHYEEDLPCVIADPQQIEQVFINIINNARQAMMDKGGGVLSIATYKEDEMVCVEFQDTGVGIKPEIMDKIFDPFFTTKEPGMGTGLGLSVSYGIIKEHNGVIEVSSRVGEGAKFVVKLPAGSTTQDVKEKEEKALWQGLAGCKVLVVDDEDSVLDFLKKFLEEEGCHVKTARDGEEAIELIEDGEFDLILLDVKMPGIDGMKVYDYIKRRKAKLAERVVFITGYMKSIGGGGEMRVIEKPFDVKYLRHVIQDVVGVAG